MLSQSNTQYASQDCEYDSAEDRETRETLEPSETQDETGNETQAGDESQKSMSRRGTEWKAWEDRALAKEVTATDLLLCPKGKSADKWEEVSRGMAKAGSVRTGKSCKTRFQRLLVELRVSTTVI